MRTDKFDMTSVPFGVFNVMGQKVEVRRCLRPALSYKKDGKTIKTPEVIWFNAYVELEGSKTLSKSFLGYPTFRKDDWVGIDTNHAFNEGDKPEERLANALHQIEGVISNWRQATEDGYYPEEDEDDN